MFLFVVVVVFVFCSVLKYNHSSTTQLQGSDENLACHVKKEIRMYRGFPFFEVPRTFHESEWVYWVNHCQEQALPWTLVSTQLA